MNGPAVILDSMEVQNSVIEIEGPKMAYAELLTDALDEERRHVVQRIVYQTVRLVAGSQCEAEDRGAKYLTLIKRRLFELYGHGCTLWWRTRPEVHRDFGFEECVWRARLGTMPALPEQDWLDIAIAVSPKPEQAEEAA